MKAEYTMTVRSREINRLGTESIYSNLSLGCANLLTLMERRYVILATDGGP